jgi:hypothetical protein
MLLRAGYQLRALLVHETFKKVLFLAPGARAEFSSGRVFNLVTSDAETLQARAPDLATCVACAAPGSALALLRHLWRQQH